MNKFDKIYQDVLKNIIDNGFEERNNRTGSIVKALPGLSFSIDLENDGFPLLTLRKQPIKSPIAEQIWFLQGEQNTEFLTKYTKIWDKFTVNSVLNSAYGWRWRNHFKKDQLLGSLELLKKDPSSRHAVVVTWDPNDDGYGGTPKSNVPCPYTFTLNIIGGRLHMHNILRSNDMILGCPFDVTGFALLQCMIAQELGIKPGIYTHSISNAHIYESHYLAASSLISRENNHPKIKLDLPADSFKRGMNKDNDIVDEIFNNLIKQYNPMPKIDNLQIIL